MPRPGVVDLDVGRDRQRRRQKFGLLLVEAGLPLGEDAAELAGGDVEAQLPQLFQKQRLGDVLVVMLVEDETDQIRPEMAAGRDVDRQRSHHASSVGGQPALAAVADDPRREDQILDDEVLVALEDRPLRRLGETDDGLLGDGQPGGLGPFGGAGPLRIRVASRPGRPLQSAGGDPGPRLETLEAGDLVFEELYPLLELHDSLVLEIDDVDQPLNQRRAFDLRDVGRWNPHNRIPPATSRPIRPQLLRSYKPTESRDHARMDGFRVRNRCRAANLRQGFGFRRLRPQGGQRRDGPLDVDRPRLGIPSSQLKRRVSHELLDDAGRDSGGVGVCGELARRAWKSNTSPAASGRGFRLARDRNEAWSPLGRP